MLATIVGVVRHVNDYEINADSKTGMYLPFVQAPMYKFTLMALGAQKIDGLLYSGLQSYES